MARLAPLLICVSLASSAFAAGVTRKAEPKGRLGAVITSDDYPADANKAVEQGVTVFRYEVDEHGRVTTGSCGIIASSGHPRLDAVACFIAEKRFRFSPALKDGKPTKDLQTQSVVWWHPEYKLKATPDMVRHLAQGYGRCMAARKPDLAQQILALPMGDPAQNRLLVQERSEPGGCAGWMRSVVLPDTEAVGSIAEAWVEQHPNTNAGPTGQPVAVKPLNPSEAFALCVFNRAAKLVGPLLFSTPTGETEGDVVRDITPHLQPCLEAGSTLSLNRATLRSLLAVAAYRVAAARSDTSAPSGVSR